LIQQSNLIPSICTTQFTQFNLKKSGKKLESFIWDSKYSTNKESNIFILSILFCSLFLDAVHDKPNVSQSSGTYKLAIKKYKPKPFLSKEWVPIIRSAKYKSIVD
jgi:hypothetical protein